MVVDLNGMQPESITTTIQTPHSTPVLPLPPADTAETSSDTSAAFNLQLTGAMEWLQHTFPHCPSLHFAAQHAKETATICSFRGSTRSQRIRSSLQTRRDGLLSPLSQQQPFVPTIQIVMQMSLQAPNPAVPSASPTSFLKYSSWPYQRHHTDDKPLFYHTASGPNKDRPTSFMDELLQLQEKMNMALEWLLANRATMGIQCRELELNPELMACLNDAQATKAITEAEVCHKNAACALQQAHQDNVLALECEAKVTEGWNHKAFAEAFGAAMQASPPKSHGHSSTLCRSLMVMWPFATILGMSATAQPWAIADRGLVPASPTSSVSGTPVLQVSGKCQYHSFDQDAPAPKGLRQDEEEAANIDDMPGECLHRKCKEGKALKEPKKGGLLKGVWHHEGG